MIRAIIIDDEEGSRNVLHGILERYIPEVEVVALCKNVPDGVLNINKFQPDVVFLDVEMPNYNGFQLLDFFQEIQFEIIFITAYSQYALKAFEVAAVDYILKPIDVDKLENSIEKLKDKNSLATTERYQSLKANLDAKEFRRIALPISDGLAFVETESIVFVKAEGAYSQVILNDGKRMLISKKIRFFEELLLEQPAFYRPHRSYLININFIKKYNRNESLLNLEEGSVIPIARDKKADFEKHIEIIRL